MTEPENNFKCKIEMTNEELLRDYISYHYVEGNITNEQRVKMEFAAADYLQKLEQLTIPVVVGTLPCDECEDVRLGKMEWEKD